MLLFENELQERHQEESKTVVESESVCHCRHGEPKQAGQTQRRRDGQYFPQDIEMIPIGATERISLKVADGSSERNDEPVRPSSSFSRESIYPRIRPNRPTSRRSAASFPCVLAFGHKPHEAARQEGRSALSSSAAPCYREAWEMPRSETVPQARRKHAACSAH